MSNQNGDRHSSDIQPANVQPEQLTAYALGQLHGEELAEVKAAVGEASSSAAQAEVREVQALAAAITRARTTEPLPAASVELRAAIEARLEELGASCPATTAVQLPAERRSWNRRWTVALVVVGGLCCVLGALYLPAAYKGFDSARSLARTFDRIDQALPSAQRERLRGVVHNEQASRTSASSALVERASDDRETSEPLSNQGGAVASTSPNTTTGDDLTLMVKPRVVFEHDEPHNFATSPKATGSPDPAGQSAGFKVAAPLTETAPSASFSGLIPSGNVPANSSGAGYGGLGAPVGGGQGGGYPGASAMSSSGPARGSGGYGYGGNGAFDGYGAMPGSGGNGQQSFNKFAGPPRTDPSDVAELNKLSELASNAGGAENRKYQNQLEREAAEHGVRLSKSEYELAFRMRNEAKSREFAYGEQVGSEQYESITENAFLSPLADPLSTFSIDVDTASYANMRRFLSEGRLPPPSAVRIEELVNYFTYSYSQPSGREPFSVNMEAAECPWNAGHLLLRVGLKGKEVHRSERPPSNLTFLLDVSGSMADANKLPLLKTTLMMFVAELSENDRVSIVTYAGEAGLRLPPTRGHEKEKIMAAIDSLSAGGSTHGSAGIQLAYEQAAQYFLKDGTNRVILATDGDLNVGITSDDALVQLIKEKAAGGTFLTVLGFSTGNLKDGKLEKLADNGNGVYAYIDGVREGRKVLVEQMSENLVTIAKDVKIQIEFNPAQIASYRLLGYENRVLAAADFNNDKKDAGEIGAGHTVTALYELVPVGAKQEAAAPQVGEPLKYQASGASGKRELPDGVKLSEASATGELLTLKLRYKDPDGVESRLVEFPLKDRGGQFNSASKDLQFASAVASFGMILRGSEHRGTGNLASVAEIAGGAIGSDPNGYRAEFVDLVRKAQALGAK